MSFDLDKIGTPVDMVAGEWVGDVMNHPAMRLKVRSKHYRPFEAAHNKLLRGMGKISSEALDADEYQAALGELLAEHILIGWEKALTKGGKDVAFDKKTAKQILSSIDDRGMGRSFRDAVSTAATTVANRHLGIVDAMVGN